MSRDGVSPRASDLPIRGRGFPLSSGERAGVRGKPTIPPLSTFLLLPAREDGPKGRMALSHSSFQASGFAGGLEFGHFSNVAEERDLFDNASGVVSQRDSATKPRVVPQSGNYPG